MSKRGLKMRIKKVQDLIQITFKANRKDSQKIRNERRNGKRRQVLY